MVLSEGDAIDDVRIYPADAQMKSYTYNPLIGVTSFIEEDSKMHIYDYDTFGRLWRVRNDKGNVEKQYTYHYQGQ
jgi:YD repeat-containing protein